MDRSCKQSGATLIEMVVSIVIISISVTGVMMVISNTTRNSADPMIRTQAMSIAQAYMDEIMVQPLNDPDGPESGGPETGETRGVYDDISDYHGLADLNGARDQNNATVVGLEGYNVQVSVTATTLGGYPAKRVEVVVGFDGYPGLALPLAAYRLN